MQYKNQLKIALLDRKTDRKKIANKLSLNIFQTAAKLFVIKAFAPQMP